jgi:hypothetical protein
MKTRIERTHVCATLISILAGLAAERSPAAADKATATPKSPAKSAAGKTAAQAQEKASAAETAKPAIAPTRAFILSTAAPKSPPAASTTAAAPVREASPAPRPARAPHASPAEPRTTKRRKATAEVSPQAATAPNPAPGTTIPTAVSDELAKLRQEISRLQAYDDQVVGRPPSAAPQEPTAEEKQRRTELAQQRTKFVERQGKLEAAVASGAVERDAVAASFEALRTQLAALDAQEAALAKKPVAEKPLPPALQRISTLEANLAQAQTRNAELETKLHAPPPAPPALPGPVPAAPPSPPSVTAKFSATFYGFVEADFIHDSTQSFSDLAGNAAIAHSGSYAAKNDRMTFGARNSRLGFKLKGPETEWFKSSGIVEMDFLGNQPQSSPSPAGSPAVSESAYFASPTFRIRHMALRLETPIVDVLAGQYWELFGWQTIYHPNSVQIQGLPGQVFSRSPQLRLSHMFKGELVNVEIAAAAVRPPQRDSGLPDGQAGVRLVLNNWKGMRTAGGAGTSVDPLSVGVSGVARRFRLPEYASAPVQTQTINGYGLSLDAIVPVVRATAQNWNNALTVTASFVRGRAIADLFTGLTGGVSLAPLPADSTGKASSFAMDIDNGLVVFDSAGTMRSIPWQAVIVGAQYYFPTTPLRLWISGNYSHMNSSGISALGGTAATNAKIFDRSDFADGNLFIDATQSIRFGLECAWFRQTYLDGANGRNSRVQFSGFYIF